MFEREARWLGAALAAYAPEALSPVLNIGSSTGHFRAVVQPWITRDLVAPLEARGIEVIHTDLRRDEGVDIVADLLDDADFARLKALAPKAVLCCNLLEHVTDIDLFARRVTELVPPGGLIFVTGPNSYPHHRDPIDNMFRPTAEEAAARFPGTMLLEGAVIDAGMSYRDHVKARPWILLRHVFRAPFPFFGWTKWKRSMGKLYWLANDYRVFCAVLRKEPAPAALDVTPVPDALGAGARVR